MMLADAIPLFGMGAMLAVLIVFSGIGQATIGLELGVVIWLVSLLWPFLGFKIAEVWANTDYLIVADLVDATGKRKRVQFWMEKAVLDMGLVIRDIGNGISEVGLNLLLGKEYQHWFPRPNGSEHARIYVRFEGEWPVRMNAKGAEANRWGFFGLWIKRADKVIMYELPWNKGFPDVPVVEEDQSIHPVFYIPPFCAPGDHQLWLDLIEKRLRTVETREPAPAQEIEVVVK